MININELRQSLGAVQPEEVAELLDRLEAAEKERDALRAKIEAMERQEPVGYGVLYVEPATGEEDWDSIWKCREFAEDHIKDFTQAYADIGEPVGEITTVPLYALPGAQPAPSFADAYQGAMGEVAIWKKRALEAEDLNRKFVAEINGPTYMGEPAQPAPSVPEGWKPIPEEHQTFDLVDLRLADGSVLCGCVPQADGDYWWEGPSGEVFIDPRYAPVTHWRLAAAPEAKPCP